MKNIATWVIWIAWSIPCWALMLSTIPIVWAGRRAGSAMRKVAEIDDRVGLRLGFYDDKQQTENNDDSDNES